jgi:hypothetical protein
MNAFSQTQYTVTVIVIKILQELNPCPAELNLLTITENNLALFDVTFTFSIPSFHTSQVLEGFRLFVPVYTAAHKYVGLL